MTEFLDTTHEPVKGEAVETGQGAGDSVSTGGGDGTSSNTTKQKNRKPTTRSLRELQAEATKIDAELAAIADARQKKAKQLSRLQQREKEVRQQQRKVESARKRQQRVTDAFDIVLAMQGLFKERVIIPDVNRASMLEGIRKRKKDFTESEFDALLARMEIVTKKPAAKVPAPAPAKAHEKDNAAADPEQASDKASA